MKALTSRKGFNGGFLIGAVLSIVVLVMIISFGVLMLDKFKTTAASNNSAVNDTIDTGITTVTSFNSYLGLLALAVIFVVVLGYILYIAKSAGGSSTGGY